MDAVNIETDELYGLIIPEGWAYNEGVDGDLRREILIEFYGLRRFRFPFTSDFFVPDHQADISDQFDFRLLRSVKSNVQLY